MSWPDSQNDDQNANSPSLISFAREEFLRIQGMAKVVENNGGQVRNRTTDTLVFRMYK
jgi:hypothetical protein